MSLHFQSALGRKEANEVRGQGMLEPAGRGKFAEITELFSLAGIQRAETNGFTRQRGDATTGKHVHSKIDGQSAGMKKVQRPDVHGPTGQVHTAGRKGDD